MSDKSAIEKSYYYTQKAGDLCRTLALGGLAFIWLLHISQLGEEAKLIGSKIPSNLQSPAFLLLIVLAIDAVQYLLGSVLWGIAGFCKPTEPSANFKIINGLLLAMVCGKLLVLGAAYISLLCSTSTFWS